MLWFNFQVLIFFSILILISIHLMLWFNYVGKSTFVDGIEFQYILCYGSTALLNQGLTLAGNFNTSYVMVQPVK